MITVEHDPMGLLGTYVRLVPGTVDSSNNSACGVVIYSGVDNLGAKIELGFYASKQKEAIRSFELIPGVYPDLNLLLKVLPRRGVPGELMDEIKASWDDITRGHPVPDGVM